MYQGGSYDKSSGSASGHVVSSKKMDSFQFSVLDMEQNGHREAAKTRITMAANGMTAETGTEKFLVPVLFLERKGSQQKLIANHYNSLYSVPYPEGGYIPGEVYGFPFKNNDIEIFSVHLFRGMIMHKGREALLFDFRASLGNKLGQMEGYRIMDAETGMFITSKIAVSGFSGFVVMDYDLDTRSWPAPHNNLESKI